MLNSKNPSTNGNQYTKPVFIEQKNNIAIIITSATPNHAVSIDLNILNIAYINLQENLNIMHHIINKIIGCPCFSWNTNGNVDLSIPDTHVFTKSGKYPWNPAIFICIIQYPIVGIAINSNMCTVTPKLQNLENVKVNILI